MLTLEEAKNPWLVHVQPRFIVKTELNDDELGAEYIGGAKSSGNVQRLAEHRHYYCWVTTTGSILAREGYTNMSFKSEEAMMRL